jgi:hypothetical protein
METTEIRFSREFAGFRLTDHKRNEVGPIRESWEQTPTRNKLSKQMARTFVNNA